MEDLLPILIGVIWLAYSYYSGKKKKNAGQSKAKESTTARALEELLGGNFFEAEEEPEPVVYEPVSSDYSEAGYTEPAASHPEVESPLEQFVSEGEPVFESDKLEVSASDSDFGNADFEKNRELFDLRKAIIYDAILNPPYIDFK
ncbi:MAG: hypothetical protein Kow00127_13630 [Bacteroidales bacterium]